MIEFLNYGFFSVGPPVSMQCLDDEKNIISLNLLILFWLQFRRKKLGFDLQYI